MPVAEQDVHALRFLYAAINASVTILGMADADVADLTTPAGLAAAIRAKSVPEQYVHLREAIAQAVEWGAANPNIGTKYFNNTNIAAMDTIAGWRTILTTLDATLTGSAHATFARPV